MNPEPLALGLTGYPLSHSYSPRLHNAALRALGLAGEYRLYPVPPLPEGQVSLSQLLDRMRSSALHGLNVTIPHKQAVLPLLDELTPEAKAIGAANTIFRSGRLLIGDNTDARGFLADLRAFFLQAGSHLLNKPGLALVLGAGGSARAIVYALACTGWEVKIAARQLEKSQALCEMIIGNIPGSKIHPQQLWDATGLVEPPPQLIVNTTPLGMWPNVSGSAWPENLPFPSKALLYDLVYNPLETRLICTARNSSIPAINGLGMLLEQAALSFERWTGQPAPREAMRLAFS